jgi:hypothetical protein
MLIKNNAENASKYICENCDFICCKKSNYEKHLKTHKHISNISGNKCNTKKVNIDLKCKNCNKLYKSRVGLWRHKKKCIVENDDENIILDNNLTQNSSEVVHLTNLVIELVKSNTNLQEQNQKIHTEMQKQTLDMQKQNQDIQKQMIDVCKNGNTNITHTNSHNKTFNMQVFLNEKCKDAMNIMDFVNSMTLQLSDLEDVGELGYVEGISKIIIRKLNEMDVYKRPIHCSDYKREVMYIRDDDIWEKENSTYDKLRKAIKHITKKNGDLMIPWRDQNPQCMNNRHRLNDVYLRIMNQSMGGKGEFVDSENKIIKKLSKAVYINKDC